jgi:CubicO group peptidase (beta-lactamase class C family)
MKSLLKFAFSLLICFYFYEVKCQNTNQTIENTLAQLDSIIIQKMNESSIVGIGAAIIVNKKLVWTKGYGYADKENKKPFTSHTIMNIASISKTFTGVCLMRALEDHPVSLDEDINKYLPFKVINPNFPTEKITLRHLATHTSSLADRYPFYGSTYHYGGDSPQDLGEFLKNYFTPEGKYYSKDNFLDKKPGTYRDYSNIAAGLAGYIVEIISGKKLNEYGKKHIFKPLKMKNTGWLLSEIDLANHSKLYHKEGDTLKPIQLYGLPTYPDGGVRTSVSELATFFIALLNEGEYKGVRILKKESAQTMQKFQFDATNKPENVNLAKLNSGIFWATKQSASKIGHAGSDPGVKTEMLANLTKDVGVILFTNTGLKEDELLKYHFGIFDALFECGEKIKIIKQK